MLEIAANLSLPLDAVTQTFAIMAIRRAGKSYTARKFAEQLLNAGQQVVIVDPKGDWWGIRSSADGKAPGYPVIVLGGEHGDLPLEVSAAEVVAKLVVYERVSVVLDLSSLRKGEVARFMGGEFRGAGGFLEHLYRLKAKEEYRSPVMLVVDEADAIAPQKPFKGEERMLGAIEDLVRRGGQRGVGCLLVTQRSAVLNKNVLTQTQVLVPMRTISPQDLAAMDAWINVHGTPEQRALLMESLPSLPTGDAWVRSPGWPTVEGIFRRVHVNPIETFDSGATPKAGEKLVKPKTLADIDIEVLRRQMAETIERAKSEDPRELRRRIVELERQAQKPAAVSPPAAPPKIERVEVPVLKDAQLKRLEAIAEKFQKAGESALASWREVSIVLERLRSTPAPRTMSAGAGGAIHAIHETKPVFHAPVPRKAETSRPISGTNGTAAGESGLRRMLVALAQRPHGLSAKQLGVRAGLSSSSGTFGTYLGKGRSAGWIDGSRDRLVITEAGLKALGSYAPLPEGRELLEYWMGELGGGAARMLQVLAEAGRAMTAEELGEVAGLSASSGTFGTYLGKLRTLELVSGSRSELRASEELV